MSRVEWDLNYDTGIERAVFYPKNSPGEVWNGIVSVEEQPETIGQRALYLDGLKLFQRRKEAPYSAIVSCYTNPESWFQTLTKRRNQDFGFTYRTTNELHLIYNATAAPSETVYEFFGTVLNSWKITTRPLVLPEGGYTSHLMIDVGTAYPEQLSAVEDLLYGTETSDPVFPTIEELLEIFEIHSLLRVIDNEDGTFTVIGPDDAITMLDSNTFEITWPSAVYTNIFEEKYTIHSL